LRVNVGGAAVNDAACAIKELERTWGAALAFARDHQPAFAEKTCSGA
jgi:hypothetical protein